MRDVFCDVYFEVFRSLYTTAVHMGHVVTEAPINLRSCELCISTVSCLALGLPIKGPSLAIMSCFSS